MRMRTVIIDITLANPKATKREASYKRTVCNFFSQFALIFVLYIKKNVLPLIIILTHAGGVGEIPPEYKGFSNLPEQWF